MKEIVPPIFLKRLLVCFSLVLVCSLSIIKADCQVSITSTSPVTESFTGFTGGATPANWNILGTGSQSLVWNGTAQTTGTAGGWYGNGNMSFLGTTNATNGNATWILQNNTGFTITGFSLSFTGTLWKNGSKSPTVTVSYSNSSSSTVPPQGALTNALSSLTFSDVNTNISGVSFSQTVSSIAIANGDYIFVRFINSGGVNGDNLGWDNITFTPVIPTVNIAGTGPSAAHIYPSTTNNILQSFSINPLFSSVTLSSLTLTTGGTYTAADLTATPFKLYYNTTNSLSGATQIGTAQAAVASGGSISFTGLSQSFAAASTRYLLVTADISGTATLNNTINIAATSFSNILFSVVPQKAGTDPVAVSNDQTIYAGLSLTNSGSPAATNIGQSSTDNLIFGFDISPAGTASSINLNSVTITATGSVTSTDMNNFKIVQDVDNSGDYSGGDVIISSSLPFSNTMSFTLSGQTGITTHTQYLLLADALATAVATHNITASINANADVSVNADITSAAAYAGNTQTIVNTAISSLAGDYFKSVALNGNWTSTSTWQSSTDNATWHAATLIPTNATTKGITIKSGTTVTIDSTLLARVLTIESGATLKHTAGKTLALSNAAALFTINGTYVLNGTRPTVGGSVVVNNGGVVQVDDNTGGQSDDFARQTNVEFKTGSVFYWNTTLAFETDNVTYFQGPNYNTNKPIFRVSQPVTVGATNPTTINGKFESTSSNPQFKNAGTKIFRDGFGGSGKLTHATNSGSFEITASDAVIDGSLILNIDDNGSVTNDLWIAAGATVTISGSPLLNIGTNAAGSNMVVDGTLIHNGTTAVQIASGNLYINGYLDPSSTGTFTFSPSTPTTNSNVSVGGTSNTYAGALKLTAGANYINTFTMNRGTSGTGGYLLMNSNVNAKNIVLTRGVLATGNNLTTWLNAGGTLTLPGSYSDSYICTCNASGVAITPNGSNGFRINNVSGASDQMFPIGTDFNSANRMALNMNSSTTDNFTVVVGKGDIGNTPLPRVNRIWYVSEGTAGGSTATMKLYFTKRDWTTNAFGSANNDEIEDGFLWSDPHLVQENYSNFFTNVATTATADVPDYSAISYNSEIFGRYYLGVSADYQGFTNGITGFTRFSVVNAEGIILSSAVTNIKAYQKGSAVQIDWTALNESNVKQYEVQRSSDGILFNSIATVAAANNGASQNNYNSTDLQPLHGNNFYRIKITDYDGTTKYTAIVKVALNNSIPSISIQPNPVVNKTINLALSNINAGKYNLVVYNLAGQRILAQTISHAGGSASQLITLPASVKAGTYFVKLFNETTDFSVRIVVQ